MRASLSLNGLWKFCPAFDEIRGNQRWMDGDSDPERAAAETVEHPDRGWIKPGFDDSAWMDISVPSSWNAALEDLWSYEGHGWYRREVYVPASWRGRRVEFVSEGANYRTAVYVNGAFAGDHEGGYNSFAIPVHEHIRFGEMNTVAVACDNEPKPYRAPGGQFGWWNHGGLYRDVSLRATDTVYIDDVTVTTPVFGTRASVDATVDVRWEGDAPSGAVAVVELFDPSGNPVDIAASARSCALVAGGEMAAARFNVPVDSPAFWTPDTPDCYTIIVKLFDEMHGRLHDTWSQRIGIRTISVDGNRLLLNGEPLLVKGVNRHEQYETGGATPTVAGMSRDIDLITWLGANAVRHHYPADRRFYDLCDERGVLAMVEVPLWQWGRPLVESADPKALDAGKRQCREIIKSLKNHPSVFIWSISNENLVKPKKDDPEAVRLAAMTADGNREMVVLAHSLDPTRPVVEVSNEWPGDPVHEVTDISCVNVYVGQPNPPLPEHLGQMRPHIHAKFEGLREQVPGKPILVGEFGKWTVRGLETAYPPGEGYQAAKLCAEWEGFLTEPNFAGAFVWIFNDYDLHRRFLWAHEFRCAYGLFDVHRRPKAAAFAVREMWRKR